MIHTLTGLVFKKQKHVAIVEVGGIGFRVVVHRRTLEKLPKQGEQATLFTYLNVREDALELYGFLSEKELYFFELLNAVAGVGPKSALAILEMNTPQEIGAAIQESKSDILSRAPGIGRKTAERIVLELNGKVTGAALSKEIVARIKNDRDVVEALVGLGYKRGEARSAVADVRKSVKGVEARLKVALRLLSRK